MKLCLKEYRIILPPFETSAHHSV